MGVSGVIAAGSRLNQAALAANRRRSSVTSSAKRRATVGPDVGLPVNTRRMSSAGSAQYGTLRRWPGAANTLLTEEVSASAFLYSPWGSTTTILEFPQPPLTNPCNTLATAFVLPDPLDPTTAECLTTSRPASRQTGISSAAERRPIRRCSVSDLAYTEVS